MAIWIDNDYYCTTLLDGDDQLYIAVPHPDGGLRQRLISPTEQVGLAEDWKPGRKMIQFRSCAEQVSRLRNGEISDPTIWIVPPGLIVAAVFFRKD